ncbi:MAG: aldo/keto reductase, partial [Candidatus Poribacteria bacterium]
MQYRILGRTGLRVSEIGYGGGRVRQTEEHQPIIDTLHRAMDLGLNFFDTAPTYGNGASETIIGKAICHRRNECIVATKTEARDPKGI